VKIVAVFVSWGIGKRYKTHNNTTKNAWRMFPSRVI